MSVDRSMYCCLSLSYSGQVVFKYGRRSTGIFGLLKRDTKQRIIIICTSHVTVENHKFRIKSLGKMPYFELSVVRISGSKLLNKRAHGSWIAHLNPCHKEGC